MPYTVLMPIFAGSVLHGGAHTLGFLMAASGVGALAGRWYWPHVARSSGLGRVVTMTRRGFRRGIWSPSPIRAGWLLSLPLLMVTGFCMMTQMASSNTILQTIVDEDKRGRVMSFYSMAFQGAAPFGSLIAGAAAAVWRALYADDRREPMCCRRQRRDYRRRRARPEGRPGCLECRIPPLWSERLREWWVRWLRIELLVIGKRHLDARLESECELVEGGTDFRAGRGTKADGDVPLRGIH